MFKYTQPVGEEKKMPAFRRESLREAHPPDPTKEGPPEPLASARSPAADIPSRLSPRLALPVRFSLLTQSWVGTFQFLHPTGRPLGDVSAPSQVVFRHIF